MLSGATTQLTTEALGATYPAWSPDGKQLIYVTGDPEQLEQQGGAVMLLDVTSGEVRSLTADGQSRGFRAPVFGSQEVVLVGTGIELIAIELEIGEFSDVVPLTGRIPNPQDPSPSPDGIRYVFSDYCGSSLQLYVARMDGSTGDTCDSAFRLDDSYSGLVSASWGPFGEIAAETSEQQIVLLPEDGSGPTRVLVDVGQARNPDFAPSDFVPRAPFECASK